MSRNNLKWIIGIAGIASFATAKAQLTTADNGLNTNTSSNVRLGGTLVDATTSLDFGTSYSNSSFLLKKGGSNYFLVSNDGTVKAYKGVILGEPTDAPYEHSINYFANDQYSNRGLKLVNTSSGSTVRLHTINNSLYITNDGGVAAGLVLGSRFNPTDNSEFRAGYQRWEIRAGSFSVNRDWTGNGQFEMTIGDAARKGMIIKSALSQTGNLMEWQDNNGNILSFMNSAGGLGVGTNGLVTKLTVRSTSNNDGLWIAGAGSTNVALLNNTTLGSWNALSQAGDNLLLWKGSGADNSDAGGLVLGTWSNSAKGMRIGSNGNIGVGISAARSKLDVWGGDLNVTGNDGNGTAFITSHGGIAYYGNDTYANGLAITPTGQIGIGTAAPGPYKLAVEGTIGARKVKVTLANPWADFVFEKDYDLPGLSEVEQFIQKKQTPAWSSIGKRSRREWAGCRGNTGDTLTKN